MNKIRSVFAGTPSFAIPSLEVLASRDDIELVGIYTQPDKPAGRGKKIRESAVKLASTFLDASVFQPRTLDTESELVNFCSLKPELLVVAAYGLMIPQNFLEVPRHCINIHASLLPKWRGAAPIQRAIMNGDQKTGISIMRIVEKLDAGPVLNIRERKIEDVDSTGTLTDKLAKDGASALDDCLSNIARGTVLEKPQKDESAIYAHKITKKDLLIDWANPVEITSLQIRALCPQPGAIANLGPIQVKVISAEISEDLSKAPPGTIDLSKKNILKIATTTYDLEIKTLQLPGKKIMTTKDFLNGYRKLL